MSFVVKIRSAHAASQMRAVQMVCGSTIADLRRVICAAPHRMFSDPASIVLVLKGCILKDDASIQFLSHLDSACITAVQVHTPVPHSHSPTLSLGTDSTSALSPAVDAIARGVRVSIHGLKQKPELNGSNGVVFCPMQDGERWLVCIESTTLVAEQAWLRPSNLTVLPPKVAVDAADPDGFDSLGLPLSCILEFIERNGGHAAFEGLTTSQVKRRFIMPETDATKQSLCEQLRRNGDARIKDAQWFVSHAWQYKFLDVVSSLQSFLASEPDGAAATLWIDAFSTSQHDTYARAPIWWQRTFVNAIGRMGRLLMVVTPWINPVTLTRAWCILELFACCNSRSRFELVMPPDQHESIFDTQNCSVSDDYLNMLSKVQCENSQCSREEDRVRIFETVRASIGFLAMDRLIFDTLGGWLLSQLNTKKQSYYEQGSLVLGVSMSRKITTMLNALGRHFDAEAELIQALQHLGVPHTNKALDFHIWVWSIDKAQRPLITQVMLDLAVTFSKQRRYDEAGPLFQQIVPMMDNTDVNQVGVMMNVAISFRGQKQFVEAERIYVHCLSALTRLLGAEHHSTIVCLNSLAITYRELKKFDAADAAFLQVIDIGKRTLGENHTDTQAAIIGLANSYRDQLRFSEAEPLYEAALEHARRTKGFSHPETLDSLANLACMNGDLGALERDRSRFERAVKMYNEAITTGTETLGPGHPLVLRWKRNFAVDSKNFEVVFGGI